MSVVDGVEQLLPVDAQARIRSGALLVDVREADEWRAARIPGALHIPLSSFQTRWEDLPRDRPVVVQCASGVRSHQVARFLRAQGYDAANLAHGIMGWARSGLPVDTRPR